MSDIDANLIKNNGRPVIIEAAQVFDLSEREIDILVSLLQKAENTKPVAFLIRVSPGTARFHFAGILFEGGYSKSLERMVIVVSDALRKKIGMQISKSAQADSI
jgi:hypothetical protein